MTWQTICDPLFSGRLCMTLVHSMWQVALLAAMAWGLGWLWRRRSVDRSYALHVAALLAGLAAMPVTYALVDVHTPGTAAQSEFTADAASPVTPPVAWTPEGPRSFDDQGEQAPRVQDSSGVPDAAAPASVTAAAKEPSAPWLQVAPWIVMLYLAGVFLMLVRLIGGTWRANRLGSRAQLIGDGALSERLNGLARRWSMRIVPALAQAEEIVVPKVVGLLRPTILLPVAVITGLSTAELEMILAHELAHVRRYDMWVNLAQRVAEVLLFFNPALWYLSRRTSALREYCCDELACRATSGSDGESRARYASALLRIVELGRQAAARGVRARQVESGDLAALAAAGRSPSDLRRRVARLFGEPLREPVRLTRGGLLTLAVLAAVLLVAPTAWRSIADTAAAPATNTIEDKAAAPRTAPSAVADPSKAGVQPAPAENSGKRFELHVVGPDGKPAAQATVEFRLRPQPTAEQIQVGQLIKTRPYGMFVKADADGRLALGLPPKPTLFSLNITQPGFGPYWAEWDADAHPEAIPSSFTAELDAGWTVGGVIVDGTGAPIEGAKVRPAVKFEKRPGDFKDLWIGETVTTDAGGRWSFASVPVSMNEVFAEINHPDYRPNRRPLTRSQFGVEPGGEPKARITLDRGLGVTGSVRDESGNPITGALVRTKFLNDLRQATTGADGGYRLAGCEPGMARIVVSAAGKARDFQDVRIEPDMKPVDFAMKPGGTIRLRVLDAQGNPVAKTTVFFQWWRGRIQYFEFAGVNPYTDEKGVWQWNEAPLDEIRADICPPGGMQILEQPFVARETEYIVRLLPPLVISGDVTDAVTGQPVKRYRVVPGLRSGEADSPPLVWARGESFEAADGHYELRPNRGYPAHVVRIEADGYEVAVSRDIRSDEGTIRIDFKLKPAGDVAVTVVTPAGAPATGAKAALGIAGSQINVKNGDIDGGGTYAARRDADQAGQFRFPAQGADFQLVITHPSGFAYLKSGAGPIPNTVRLTPWARVEGTFRVGQRAVPSAGITLNTNAPHAYGFSPSIYASYDVTTAADGRFVFERVVPGDGRIGRRIFLTTNDGATEMTSSKMVAVRLVSGETTKLDLGGTGRPVTGRLVPPAGFQEQVLWNFALVNVQVDLPEPKWPPIPAEIQNDPAKSTAWMTEWKATAEGKAWQTAYEAYNKLRAASPHFMATVDREGAFHIDDVPAGKYMLSVQFSQHPAGHVYGYAFSVPEPGGAESTRPLDLGVLTLVSQ